jgi:hypothetical protein
VAIFAHRLEEAADCFANQIVRVGALRSAQLIKNEYTLAKWSRRKSFILSIVNCITLQCLSILLIKHAPQISFYSSSVPVLA